MATAVQTALNAAGSGITFTVTYNTNTFAFSITANAAAQLYFGATNAILTTALGVTPVSVNYVCPITTNAANLQPITMLNLYIQELERSILDCGNAGVANPTSGQLNLPQPKTLRSTFIIPIKDGIATLNTNTQREIVEVPSSRSRSIDRLTVQLTDLDGTVIDLNKVDWQFKITIWDESETPSGILNDSTTLLLKQANLLLRELTQITKERQLFEKKQEGNKSDCACHDNKPQTMEVEDHPRSLIPFFGYP